MAGATSTTLANHVATYMTAQAKTLDSRNTPLLNAMPVIQSPGGDSVDWIVNSAGNTSSTTFSEGDSPAAAGYQEYYALTIAKSAFQYRTMYQITGTAMDSLKNGYFDGIAEEARGALLDHMVYIEDNTVTTIEAAIDSGGSYGGQTRANANTASYEAAVTPTLDEMATMWSGMAADPRSVPMDDPSVLMLAPVEFQTSYGDVATGQTAFEYNAVQGGVIDAGRLAGGSIFYNKKPFTTISTMTDTTCLIVDAAKNLRRTVFRPLRVEQYAQNDDSMTFAITSVEVPWVINPRHAGKLT